MFFKNEAAIQKKINWKFSIEFFSVDSAEPCGNGSFVMSLVHGGSPNEVTSTKNCTTLLSASW